MIFWVYFVPYKKWPVESILYYSRQIWDPLHQFPCPHRKQAFFFSYGTSLLTRVLFLLTASSREGSLCNKRAWCKLLWCRAAEANLQCSFKWSTGQGRCFCLSTHHFPHARLLCWQDTSSIHLYQWLRTNLGYLLVCLNFGGKKKNR